MTKDRQTHLGHNGPSVLHVDMDAFFASVEILRRPELQGQPVLVGGAGPRGVVAAASYPARVFGVRSAMPMSTALRLCPTAVVLPGDHDLYRSVSARIMAIFNDITPAVEPLSLDEAFLDVSSARSLLGNAEELAKQIRSRVFDQERLRCSVGIARTKHVAKLASDAAKPRVVGRKVEPGPGVMVVTAEGEAGFLRPLPIRAMWGVGPKTADKLVRLGVVTVGDLADLDVDSLVACLGEASGRHLHALANGIDNRPVEVDRPTKSISQESTFPTDLTSMTDINSRLVSLADGVASRLRQSELFSRTISIKVRLGSFETMTRSVTLPAATSMSREIANLSRDMFAQLESERGVLVDGVRLLGVSAGGLTRSASRQLTLNLCDGPPHRPASQIGGRADGRTSVGPNPAEAFGPLDDAEDGVDDAVDTIRSKFGDLAIGRGGLTVRTDNNVESSGEGQAGPKDL